MTFDSLRDLRFEANPSAMKCPYCHNPLADEISPCPACTEELPWIVGDSRIVALVKERETSRIRAIATFVQDLESYVRRGTPFPIHALRGLVTALLLPRVVLVAGGMLAALAGGTQVWILYQQTVLMERQTTFLSNQTFAAELSTLVELPRLRAHMVEVSSDLTLAEAAINNIDPERFVPFKLDRWAESSAPLKEISNEFDLLLQAAQIDKLTRPCGDSVEWTRWTEPPVERIAERVALVTKVIADMPMGPRTEIEAETIRLARDFAIRDVMNMVLDWRSDAVNRVRLIRNKCDTEANELAESIAEIRLRLKSGRVMADKSGEGASP